METQQDWKYAYIPQEGEMKSIKTLGFSRLNYSLIPRTTYLILST